VALEKAKTEKEIHGEFESECPGYCGAQDTFYVGKMKGVGRIYQQTFIDTYAKAVFAKLYDRKTPITVPEVLNDRALPFFEEHGIVLCRVLTDRGTEYCGILQKRQQALGFGDFFQGYPKKLRLKLRFRLRPALTSIWPPDLPWSGCRSGKGGTPIASSRAPWRSSHFG
jgi:hypothetical protein